MFGCGLIRLVSAPPPRLLGLAPAHGRSFSFSSDDASVSAPRWDDALRLALVHAPSSSDVLANRPLVELVTSLDRTLRHPDTTRPELLAASTFVHSHRPTLSTLDGVAAQLLDAALMASLVRDGQPEAALAIAEAAPAAAAGHNPAGEPTRRLAVVEEERCKALVQLQRTTDALRVADQAVHVRANGPLGCEAAHPLALMAPSLFELLVRHTVDELDRAAEARRHGRRSTSVAGSAPLISFARLLSLWQLGTWSSVLASGNRPRLHEPGAPVLAGVLAEASQRPVPSLAVWLEFIGALAKHAPVAVLIQWMRVFVRLFPREVSASSPASEVVRTLSPRLRPLFAACRDGQGRSRLCRKLQALLRKSASPLLSTHVACAECEDF